MQAQQQKALKAVAIAVATITLSAYNNDNQRINTVNQTDLTTRFSTRGFAHTLLTGIELGHQDSDNKRNTGFFGAPTSATVSTGNPYAIATRFRQNTTDANNKVVDRHRRTLRAVPGHAVGRMEAARRSALRLLQGQPRRPPHAGAGSEPRAHRHRLQPARRPDLDARQCLDLLRQLQLRLSALGGTARTRHHQRHARSGNGDQL